MSPAVTQRVSRKQANPRGSLRQAHTAAMSKHRYNFCRKAYGPC